MQKHCPKCNTSKNIEDFHKKNSLKGTYQNYCKICATAARVDYYKRNRTKEHDYDKERRNKLKIKLLDYLKDKECVDCKEKDPIVLEFDHLKDKKEAVTVMAHKGHSWKKILEEIDKCEIRCANCHRRKTAFERGYLRAQS
jgi:hypothetical protein